MNEHCYRDHGSPVRRARADARVRLPCPGCGSGKDPELRKPRHFSEAWYRNPASYFGCAGCGVRLAGIEGPAADRPSQAAVDRIPDPEGTLRAMLTRDPGWVRSLATPGSPTIPLRLEPVMGPAVTGIEIRAGCELRVPVGIGTGSRSPQRIKAPLALIRHAMPWVVWQVEPVEEILAPASAVGCRELSALLECSSVEAAFTVTIDLADRWQVRRLRSLGGDGSDAPSHRSSRRY